MRKMLFLVGICFTLCMAVPVRGATWYVGPGGDLQKIQEAIDAAANGDAIIVSQGTYVENIRFSGKNITLTSTDPLDPNVVASTVIDGNQAGSVVSFTGTENETCVLSGLTIRNGSGTQTSSSWTTGGGGIWGGGDGANRTRATIRNNIITANAPVGFGGVGYGDGGGVLFCDGLIESNIISNNRADDGGGLCHCHGIVQNNTITGNRAGYGGAFYACSGIIQNNLISDNTADWRGGGLDSCDGVVQNNLIAGNTAVGLGGGLWHCNGPVVNNTIVGNSAATHYGGGMGSCEGIVINCIIWGNTAPSDPQVHYSPPRHCCIQGWTGGGVGNISADPLFLDLDGPDNNPNTYDDNDYHLQLGSPCINAGANYYWLAWPQRDMDGNCRLAGTTVDIGCHEHSSSVDSDGDLLRDADESAARTDAAIQDTDTDGLRDGLEILRGSNPRLTTLPEIINIGAGDTLAIQSALSLAVSGDEIILDPGTYQANLVFCGADVTLRSTDPLNPDVVASTVLDGAPIGRVIAFSGHESDACVLSGLTITNGLAYFGGGLYGGLCGMGFFIDSPRVATHATIQNNVITGNSAGWQAGGLHSCDGLIENNTISNNSSDGYAGGLYQCHGTIRNNIITGNWADSNGGALYECDGTIQNNIVTGNSGGGLFRCDGAIRSNLIAGNSAGTNGGGLSECHGTIRNNTIAYNSAGELGGGLYWCQGSVMNCIIWGNAAPRSPQIYRGTAPTYSCIQGKPGGEGNTSADPKFVGSGDYHLSPGSPCIDTGMNEDWMLDGIDLDGNPRIFNGRVDMGAYEYAVNLPPVVTIIKPADGSRFASAETIVFRGTATDEDEDLSDSLVWTSSKDGKIGTGASFSRTLSDGRHTITASATDSNGATGSDSVTITVGTLTKLNVSVTTDKSTYKLGEWVVIKVLVTDSVGNPVRGASVHVDIIAPKGKVYPYDGTSGTDGLVYFWHQTQRKDGTGTYRVNATASHPQYESGSASTTFNVSS